MRILTLSLLLIAAAWAQTPLASLMGTATTITPDQLVVRTGAGSTTLYSDDQTEVWHGESGKVLTVVQPGDKVLIRYRQDSTRPVIVDLYANITHVWGRIIAVTKTGFEVDQNFNADPQSAYRRARQIAFNSDTQFEESVRPDLRVGRTVYVAGLETTDSSVQATRVIVYDGILPTRPARSGTFVFRPAH
jgi:hypothetical protein